MVLHSFVRHTAAFRYIDLVLVHFPRDRYTGDDDAFEVNKQGRKDVWQKLEELKGGVFQSLW